MYRIDNSTAATSLPAPGAVGPNPNSYFTDGNPGGGVGATIVDADWANAVQEEVCAAVEGTGAALSKTTRTQLRDALRQFFFAHGDCRLAYVSATQIKLSPRNGNIIRIAGVPYAIPSGGITAANTSVYVNGVAAQNLAASTLYYVYLFNNSGTLTIDYSTTGHATDTTAGNVGVEIKSADNSRSLVGMVWTNGSSQFSALCVASWFNRNLSCYGSTTFTPSTSAGSLTQLSGTVIDFVTWADEGVRCAIIGTMSNSASGTVNETTSPGFDGAAGGAQTSVPTTGAGVAVICTPEWNVGPASSPLSEGHHTAAAFGAVGSGTGTWSIGVQLTLRQ